MKTKRLLFGTLAGTVSMFILGAVLYGMALRGFFEANSNSAVAQPMEQMNFPLMILSNMVWALLIALIIDWTGSWSASAGLRIGAVVGGLAVFAYDVSMHAVSTLYNNFTVLVVDTIVMAVMIGISGALIGWVMSKAGASRTAAA